MHAPVLSLSRDIQHHILQPLSVAVKGARPRRGRWMARLRCFSTMHMVVKYRWDH